MVRPSGLTAKAFGGSPTSTAAVMARVCVSATYTVVPLVEMKSRAPSGDTRTTNGLAGEREIVATCCAPATSTTPTFCEYWLVTYAVAPSGEKSTSVGMSPVGMNHRAVRLCALVIPTPPWYGSVKQGRPSSRTDRKSG